jgi:hypothetical protein
MNVTRAGSKEHRRQVHFPMPPWSTSLEVQTGPDLAAQDHVPSTAMTDGPGSPDPA